MKGPERVYAKVFRQIYDSSIADDWQVRVVFEDLLVLADHEGFVDMTPEAISARTRIPLPVISRALVVLQRPDPKSRTPDNDGRRIVLLDSHRSWGWRIVNYEKYRSIKCEFDRRTYMRKYMRVKRKGIGKTESLTGSNKTLTPPSPSSSVLEGGAGGDCEVELPPGFPVTVDDAIRRAAIVGCDPIFATAVWNKAMGRGGRDAKEVPIRSFPHHLATEWSYEQERRSKTQSSNGHTGKLFPRDLKLQMDAIQREIECHPANPSSISHTKRPTDLERESLKALRKKFSELNATLANGGQSA